ncbi:MAG: Ig-like domain-containing protein [Promethearchaeota archaeon]
MKFNVKIIAIIIISALAGSGITSGIFLYLINQPTGVADGENLPPSLSGLPDITLPEDSQQLDAFNLSDYSSDPDSDPLTYSILVNSNPNCGVSIDAENLVDIIPLAEWSGFSYVTIEVSDGILTATDVFTVNITIINDPLFIVDFSPLSNPVINENQSQEFAITISDVDNTLFTYEWNLWYEDMALNFSHLGGTSDNYVYNTDYFSNGTHTVKVNVTDGENVVEKVWILTVNNINRAPEIVEYWPTIPNPAVNPWDTATFTIRIYDPDNDPLTVSWYAGGVLQQIGGNYTYVPVGDGYVIEIKVIITDGELEDQQIWNLGVNPEP